MFDRQSLHVALLLWGCVISLIAAVCVFMSENFEKEKKFWVICQQIASAGLLLSDAFAWGYRGHPGNVARGILYVSNFLVFALSDILLLLFHGYLCCYLFPESRRYLHPVRNQMPEKEEPTRRIRAVTGIAVASFLLVILSQFTHLYYYIDAQNYYHRGRWHFVSMLLPLIGMFLDLTILIQYRRKVTRNIFRAMLSYIILPCAAGIVQIFFYGISLTNIAISLAVVVMLIETIMEQGQTALRKEQKLIRQEKLIVQQKIELVQSEKELMESRITSMLSQIRSHFIFNTLGMISGYCKVDPVKADEALTRFSRYLRRNMNYLERTSTIPFEMEIKQIEDYVVLEQMRFGDMIEFGEALEVRDFKIPPLTVQPLVENAIKHGLTEAGKKGTVSVLTRQEKNRIVIEVMDDGAGFDTQKVKYEDSVGIRNVRYRLKHMADAQLQIKSTPGKGTRAMILIPVTQTEK